MSGFLPALWAEVLKARRSLISLLTAAAICLLPLIWLKPIPNAFSIVSSSKSRIRPAAAAPEINPKSCVANQPSVMVQSLMSIAKASRV